MELKTPRFSTAIGSNLYADERVEYFSVFLAAVISATVPASVITQIPGNDKIMLCIAKTQGNRKYKHTAAASSRWLTDIT